MFRNNIIVKFSRLIWAAFGKYRYQIGVMAVFSFISGILEGVGINAIIPLFSFLDNSQSNLPDVISKSIRSFFYLIHIDYTVKYLLIFIAVLFVIKAAILFFNTYLAISIMTDYERSTRSDLFKAMLFGDWPYLSKQKVGYLDQILLIDLDRTCGIPYHLSFLMIVLVSLVVYTFLAINISLPITFLALIFAGCLFLIFKPLFSKTRASYGALAHYNKKLAHFVSEHVIGMKTVKSAFMENPVLIKAQNYFDRMRSLRMRSEVLKSITNVLFQPVAVLFILGIFALFYKTILFKFASFAVIVYAINRIFGSIQAVQGEFHDINSRIPHLISVLGYKAEADEHQESDLGSKNFSFEQFLEFKNVSFNYESGKEILSDFSLKIPSGGMMGLIGPSGAGKTTIVDLLLRLLVSQKGEIFLDGVNIREISLAEWRRSVGYVSQDIFLLNDTIKNNIRFYDEGISEAEIEEVSKQANIYDFIMSQTKGFDTVVGERGLRLSGGQRQRVVLARVLARRPKLLILDEATSALDNESEVLIQKAIQELRGKVTVVAIAHRLSTLINFDRLAVLENGRIVEEGSPHELLKNKESYFYKVYHLKQ